MSTAQAVADPANAPAKKGKGKLFIILAGVIVLAAGAGGGWFYMHRKAADKEHAEAPKEVKKAPAVFVPLDTFTVNLADREHFLQVGIVFEVEGAEIGEAMKAQMPVIRSRILMLLSSKTSDELATVEGKQKLAEELLREARTPLAPKGDTAIATVHFSAFVIQ